MQKLSFLHTFNVFRFQFMESDVSKYHALTMTQSRHLNPPLLYLLFIQ